MRTILRQAISNSQRRESYLMERRIHAQEEISEASDNRNAQGEDKEGKSDKAEAKENQVNKAKSG